MNYWVPSDDFVVNRHYTSELNWNKKGFFCLYWKLIKPHCYSCWECWFHVDWKKKKQKRLIFMNVWKLYLIYCLFSLISFFHLLALVFPNLSNPPSPPSFHPFIPLSPQSRRQQDPSPGSNMGNADVEHNLRWGGRECGSRGWRKRRNLGASSLFTFNTIRWKIKLHYNCWPTAWFNMIIFTCQTFFHYLNVEENKLPELIELKVNKRPSQRKIKNTKDLS